jgi:hypothetical protein
MKLSDEMEKRLTEYGLCRRRLIKYGTCAKNPAKAVRTMEAEKFNDLVKDKTFDLDWMSTRAVLLIKNYPKADIREHLLKCVRKSFETETDPITKKPMGGRGITEPMLLDLIELKLTGKIAPKPKPIIKLSQSELELLDSMRICIMSKCKSEDEKDKFVALYKKIRGL